MSTVVPQTVFAYLRSNPIRGTISVCIFVIEFFWLMAYVKSANWKQRTFPWKVFFFFKMLIVMALFEALRWIDVVYRNIFHSKEQTATTGSAASPVDKKYIEKNRGYK